MELGFSIANAGPLTQVAIPLISADKLVSLVALGYQKWNSNTSRQQTLAKVISASGVVINHSNFNYRHYASLRREHDCHLGIFSDLSHRLVKWNLTNTSSAVPDDPGLACLRALVTGLLLLVSEDSAIRILVNILPQTIFEYPNPDTPRTIEGPKLAILQDFVKNVAAEEEADKIRDHIYEALDSELGLLALSNGLGQNGITRCGKADQALIQGFLGWYLTPRADRTNEIYPTSSSLVWSLGFVLSYLGFGILASRLFYEDGPTNTSSSSTNYSLPEVKLSTGLNARTDPEALFWSGYGTRDSQVEVAPRIVPLQAVPALLTQDLISYRGASLESLVQLETAFFSTFLEVRDYFLQLKGVRRAAGFPSIHESKTETVPENIYPNCKNKTSKWLSWPSESAFHPYDPGLLEWKPIKKSLEEFADSRSMADVVVYASILGIASIFLTNLKEEEAIVQKMEFVYRHPLREFSYDSQPDSAVRTTLEQVLSITSKMESHFFSADLRVFESSPIGPECQAQLRSYRSRFLDEYRIKWYVLMTTTLLGYSSFGDVGPKNMPLRHPVNEVACQAFGALLAPQYLMDFSLELSNIFTFQFQRGHILGIPVVNYSIMDVSEGNFHPLSINVIPNPRSVESSILETGDSLGPAEASRWLGCAVDPHWEGDPRDACLSVTANGRIRGYFRIGQFVETVHSANFFITSCQNKDCDHISIPNTKEEVDRGHWRRLPLQQMLSLDTFLLKPPPPDERWNKVHWLLDARANYAIGLIGLLIQWAHVKGPKYRIFSNCVREAFRFASQLREITTAEKNDISQVGKLNNETFLVIIGDVHKAGEGIGTDFGCVVD